MNKFRFLDWEVYRDSKELLNFVFTIVRKLPSQYRFELGSQIIRSAFSIVLNIAEGSGKTSDKELNRYFEIALGSINETLAALDVLKDNQMITKEEFDKCFHKLDSVSNQLGGFKKRLINSR